MQVPEGGKGETLPLNALRAAAFLQSPEFLSTEIWPIKIRQMPFLLHLPY